MHRRVQDFTMERVHV